MLRFNGIFSLSSEASEPSFSHPVGDRGCAFLRKASLPNQFCLLSTFLEWLHYRWMHPVQAAAKGQILAIKRQKYSSIFTKSICNTVKSVQLSSKQIELE